METTIYNQKGKSAGKIKLSEKIFDLPWNGDLVHQVVVSMQSNARTPVAHTKDRSEVSGGGKKPWRQKGTGRARHGSSRSPIWIGGGVTHGPRNDKDYSKKINKKMKTKALYTVLSEKMRNGEVIFVDSLDTAGMKATQAKEIMAALSTIPGAEGLATKKKNAAYIGVPSSNDNVVRSFSNFGNVLVDDVRNMNPVRLLSYKYLIISAPEESMKILSKEVKEVAEKVEKKEAAPVAA